MKMKVNIVTTESFPKGMAATQRIRCYAKALSENGIQCKIWILGRYESGAKSGKIDSYTYKRLNGIHYEGRNKLILFLLYSVELLALIKKILFMGKSDKILLYTYSLILIRLVVAIAHLKNIRVYYELNEHPQILFGLDLKNKNHLKKIKTTFKNVDGFIVISKALYSLLLDELGFNKKIVLIPILYEKENLYKLDYTINNGVPYFFHSGSLTQRKDGILTMLKIFANVIKLLPKSYKLDFILTGFLDKSLEKEKMMQIIEENDLIDRIKFVGYLSSEDLLYYQRNAYLSMILKESNIQNDYCLSTKLCEYLNSETLVVCTNVSDISLYLKSGEDSIIISEKDIESLPQTIVSLLIDKDKRDEIVKNGKSKSKDYFYYKQAFKPLISLFQ